MKEKDDFLLDDDSYIDNPDNKRWELDHDKTIYQLMVEIRKRANARGVAEIQSWFRVALSKNIALSNFTKDEIKDEVLSFVDAFNLEMIKKADVWGIEKSDWRSISRWVEVTFFTYLKKSQDDGERKYRSEAYSMREMYSHDEVHPNEISSGGFGLSRFFGKKKEKVQDDERNLEM